MIERDIMSMTTDQLAMELFDLKELEVQPYLSEARKESIRRRMAHISFELGFHSEPEVV